MSKKIIVRAVLGSWIFIFSSLLWLSLSTALNDGPDWLQKSLWSLAAFLFLGVGAGLAYLMEERNILFYALPPLIILPALVFLKEGLITGLVLALAILFLTLAVSRADLEKTLRIELAPWFILKRGLGSFITALALIVTLFFYFAPVTQSLGQEISVPRPLFDVIARPAIDLALQMSLPVGVDPKSLPPELKNQQTELLDKIYVSLNGQIELAGRTFKKWLPLGASVSLFFTFKVIGIFLSWLIIPVIWLIFRIFLWSGVVRIEKVAVEKERITI